MMSIQSKFLKIILALIIILNISFVNAANTANKRIWNLNNVELLAVIGEISKETGKNFLIDPQVSGKVTLVSSHPMESDEAYQVFLSILQILGYIAVDSGDVVKIVPQSLARSMATPVVNSQNPGHGDEMVVRVVTVRHVSAMQMSSVLRNLISNQGSITAYQPSNSLIIADYAANINKLLRIIQAVDKNTVDSLEIIRLDHGNANEIVSTLTNLLQDKMSYGDSPKTKFKLAADNRINAVIVMGDKEKRLQIRAMIANLDAPAPKDSSNTHVYYLKNQKAKDIVTIVSGIAGAYYGTKGSGTATSYNSNQGTVSAPGAKAGATPSAPVIGSNGIIEDPTTNSIILTGPPELIRSLRSIISQLDIRRAQVLIEAAIVEVDVDDNLNLGIEWRTNQTNNGWRGGFSSGGTTADASTALVNGVLNGPAATGTDPFDILPFQGLTLGFIKGGQSIRAIVNALKFRSNANIVSTPSLVVLDNQKASISIQEEISYNNSSITSNTGAVTTGSAYKNSGLKLEVTPMLTKGEVVRLEVNQQLGNTTGVGANGNPNFLDREIDTTVLVDDKDILVLGGLIRETDTDVITKIPYIGDIPIIGNLAKSRSKAKKKTNLMIFIRPVILRSKMDNINVTASKYDMMRGDQILQKVDPEAIISPDKELMLPPHNPKDRGVKLPWPF
tara:strand:+ start:11032 stop:13053 length:2022 start_codon:yes stop_codon:yes gene_type:complete